MTSRLRTLTPAALTLACLLLPSTAGAQALGIQGGVTFSEYKFKTASSPAEGRLGGVGGIFVILGEGTFGGTVEALVSRRGTKTAAGTEIVADYLEIPLAARIVFGAGQNFRLNVLFGGTFGFKLRASQTGPPIFGDVDEDIDGLDTGVMLGGGLEFGRLIANGRYVWGTRDVSDRPVEAYNRGFMVLVGVKLIGQ